MDSHGNKQTKQAAMWLSCCKTSVLKEQIELSEQALEIMLL
jgi:hypothetical protein